MPIEAHQNPELTGIGRGDGGQVAGGSSNSNSHNREGIAMPVGDLREVINQLSALLPRLKGAEKGNK